MADDPGWYEVIKGPNLFQGDLLKDCPIPAVVGLENWPVAQGQNVQVDVETYDVIIMSQSCDLANDKVHDVVLTQVLGWTEACGLLVQQGNELASSSKFREKLVSGDVPGLSLLHKREQPPSLPWSIADFHRIFVLSKRVVQAVANSAGHRLRLRPPYREHLAQAFARYFMRVGLPHEAKAFIEEGKARA